VAPGSGWALCPGNALGAAPGAGGIWPGRPVPGGDWFCSVTAFCATDGGSAGPTAAAAGAAGRPPACGAGDGGGAGGAIVRVCPLGLVTVTTLVVWLITTVLWMLV